MIVLPVFQMQKARLQMKVWSCILLTFRSHFPIVDASFTHIQCHGFRE